MAVCGGGAVEWSGKRHGGRDLPGVGVAVGGAGADCAGPDDAAIAGGFGGIGVRVESLTQLEAELTAAFATDKQRDTFTLLHCPIPRHAYDDRI